MIPFLTATIALGLHTAAPCTAVSAPAAGALFYLESSAKTNPTTLTVRLCLAMAAGTRIGSMHLELPYDSLALRVTGSSNGAGMIVSNTEKRGLVSVASASPAGMAKGLVMTVVFQRLRHTTLVPVDARVVEVTGTDGRDIRTKVRFLGFHSDYVAPTTAVAPKPVRSDQPSKVAAGSPGVRIDSIVPPEATRPPGGLLAIMISGKGFTAADNDVLLNGVRIASITSSDAVTGRFILPSTFPSNSEAPPPMIMPGDYTLQIRNARGVSNIVKFTLRNP